MMVNPIPIGDVPKSKPRPDFFIVGQPKSGSTALYEMLRQHPQVYMPELKEPDFFAVDLQPRFTSLIDGDYPHTLEEYLELFRAAKPGQAVGEASILYLRSHVAASRIADFNPGSRIVAVLREPAQLLRSFHLQLIQTRVETVKDLRTALALENERRHGHAVPRSSRRPQLLLYSEHVRYVEQLKRFHDVFPCEQMLVLVYDDLLRDNQGTVRQISQFLGINDAVKIVRSTANPSVFLRSASAEDLLHRVSFGRGPAFRAAKRAIRAVSSQRMRRHLLKIAYGGLYGPPPPVDEELMAEIRRRFAPEVECLSEYMGRDLVSLWNCGD